MMIAIIFIPLVCLLPDITYKMAQKIFFPNPSDIMVLTEKTEKFPLCKNSCLTISFARRSKWNSLRSQKKCNWANLETKQEEFKIRQGKKY